MQVAARTLVIAGDQDIMIPSAKEAEQLSKLLPNCRSRVLQYRSHAVLQEAGVNLIEILQDEDFIVRKRVLTGKPEASSGVRKAGGFGRCAPVKLSALSAQAACALLLMFTLLRRSTCCKWSLRRVVKT